MKTPRSLGDRLKPIVFMGFFVALVSAVASFGGRPGYYPNVVVDVPAGLQLHFLRDAYPEKNSCELTATTIANAIRVSCPSCRISAEQCITRLKPQQQKLLSTEPLDVPSARTADGVILYSSGDLTTAITACREAEKHTASNGRLQAKCFAANTVRSTVESLSAGSNLQISASGLLILLIGFATAAFASYLIIRYESLHSRWSTDPLDARPQAFHSVPTPRVGGLCLLLGLFAAQMALGFVQPRMVQEHFGYLLIAALPAFVIGITEDVTKAVSVVIRLAVTMVAAACGAWFLNAIVTHIDISGVDRLLAWMPIAIAFTIFAVAGVANAVNIIDGYNGLAAGYIVIVLAALSFVAFSVRDTFVLMCALGMMGALIGFLMFNYPRGRIFLGDSGAYLAGFWTAELSVLLVARHPEVSPWFPLSLLIYPVFETLFSIYRRKVLRGKSPGHPDRLHLHQVIYMRLVRMFVGTNEPDLLTKRNSLVAPYIWATAAIFAALCSVVWDSTAWLMALSGLFCVAYVWFYTQIVRWRTPVWLVRKHSG